MQITLDTVTTERFRVALGRLKLSDTDKVLCAVSGGPDSIALLLLAKQVLEGRFAVATVDHQLRPGSRDEANYVRDICGGLGIPHVVLHPDEPIAGNIQSSARSARYALLERAADELDCTHIATAHHSDDQMETLLMRVARGSGVDGLSSIRATNGRVIRPLLDFSKAELIDICNSARVNTVFDPSNANLDYDRVAIRQWLARTDHPFRADRAARTARASAEASDALHWMTDMLAEQRIRHDNGIVICDTRDIPSELKRRLLLRSLAIIDAELVPRGDSIDRLLEDLAQGGTATIGNIKCLGGEYWQFLRAPARRS